MIGLDTNVLIRYLVQDDPVQSAQATRLIEDRLFADNPGFVSVVTIAEIAWVLTSAYRLAGAELAGAIEHLLASEALAVEREQEVFTAMVALREGRGSFADALIGALGIRAGCEHTLTFDKKAARLSSFELV